MKPSELIASCIILYISVAAGDILNLGRKQEHFFKTKKWGQTILVFVISYVAVGGFEYNKSKVNQPILNKQITDPFKVYTDNNINKIETVGRFILEKCLWAGLLTIFWYILQLF